MPLTLRAFFITILRFCVLLVMAIALREFEVSPLPDWTLTAFAYVLHFCVTFLFASWVLAKRIPNWADAALVLVFFLVVGTGMEIGLYAWLVRPQWQDLLRGFNWQSLYLIILYTLAILAAVRRAQKRNLAAKMPEGLTGE